MIVCYNLASVDGAVHVLNMFVKADARVCLGLAMPLLSSRYNCYHIESFPLKGF